MPGYARVGQGGQVDYTTTFATYKDDCQTQVTNTITMMNYRFHMTGVTFEHFLELSHRFHTKMKARYSRLISQD